MRQQLPLENRLHIDAEGYPGTGALVPVPGRLRIPMELQKDEESGELVHDQVFVLRRSPETYPSFPDPTPRLLQEVLNIPWALEGHSQVFQYIQQPSVDLRLTGNIYGLPPRKHQQPGIVVRSRPMFQIPPEALQERPDPPKTRCCRKIVHVNVWQEFIYGPPVLMLERYRLTREELRGLEPITSCMGQYFRQSVVNYFLYTFFFGAYFLYCCIFHNLLELALLFLYGSHLTLHHLANSSNVDMIFTGSLFQGPAYALIRFLCQHCDQKENAKVMWRQMAKMKKDILNAKVS